MRKIRMGIIGTGLAFERLHYPAYQELREEYEIVALSDADLDKARSWAGRLDLREDAAYADFRRMIDRDDLDAVDIMVPIALNYEVTETVARAWGGRGKAIICEKPLAPTIEQALAHLQLPRQYGIPIMIAENYRFDEEHNKLRDLVQADRAGKAVYFIQNSASCFPCQMEKNTFAGTEWRQHPTYPGGDLLDAAIHDLAGLRHVFGGIYALQAFGRRQDDDFSPCAVFNVNIKFWSGLTGQFAYYDAGREPQRPLIGLRIFCTRGEIYLEEPRCGIINVAYSDGGAEQVPYRPGRGYYNELLHFYRAFWGQEQLSVTPELEFGDARTVFAILQSMENEEIVRVDEEPGRHIPDPVFERPQAAEFQQHLQ